MKPESVLATCIMLVLLVASCGPSSNLEATVDAQNTRLAQLESSAPRTPLATNLPPATSSPPTQVATDAPPPQAEVPPSEQDDLLEQLVRVESLSPISFDNESDTKARYWDVVFRNDDSREHAVSVIYRWDEDVHQDGEIITERRALPSSEWSLVSRPADNEYVHKLPANSTQPFHVIVEDSGITDRQYSNGQNLRSDIISVDGVPLRPVEDIWPLLDVQIADVPHQPGRCQITITNNDSLPHVVAGHVRVDYTYEYRGEHFEESFEQHFWNWTFSYLASGESAGGFELHGLSEGVPCSTDPSFLESGKHLTFMQVGPVTLELLSPQYSECSFTECEGPTKEYSVSGCDACTPSESVDNIESVATSTTCSVNVDPELSGAWDRGKLGCPTATPNTIWAAWQPFEGGSMFWREDKDSLYVLRSAAGGSQVGGQWSTPPDGMHWDGSSPHGVGLTPPPGLYEPIRGFGWLWREYLGGEQSYVGWALDQEKGICVRLQPFDRGLIFRSSTIEFCKERLFNWARDPSFSPILIALYSDGSWQRF